MRLNLNSERRISAKRLNDSDLNRKGTTHQTHIGLCDDSLTFRDQANSRGRRRKKFSALLFYNDRLYVEPCEIKKITRKSGKRECTKVSMGNRNGDNLVKKIREITSQSDKDFYMMWFATDKKVPVFMLLEDDSENFNKFNDVCDFRNLPNGRPVTFSGAYFDEIESLIG